MISVSRYDSQSVKLLWLTSMKASLCLINWGFKLSTLWYYHIYMFSLHITNHAPIVPSLNRRLRLGGGNGFGHMFPLAHILAQTNMQGTRIKWKMNRRKRTFWGIWGNKADTHLWACLYLHHETSHRHQSYRCLHETTALLLTNSF